MTTQAAEHTETVAEVATSKGELVKLAPPRLPYHPAVEERFKIDRAGWNALVGAIFPSAKSAEAIIMALSYCRARNLDVFKRPVHIVPMWSSAIGGYVETVWPGIAELRTTAFRTGNYAGCDETEFGPMVESEFSGRIKVKGQHQDVSVKVTHPEWARVTVYRLLAGNRCKFVGPKVRWLEAYATTGASDVPNDMWQGRPEGQNEKCAEAAALRKAFPEEIGNQLTAEEMYGRHLGGNVEAVAHGAAPEPPTPPEPNKVEPPTEVAGSPAALAAADAETQSVVWEESGERPATAADAVEPPTPGDEDIPAFVRLSEEERAAGRNEAKAAAAPAKPATIPPVQPKVAEPPPDPKPAAKAKADKPKAPAKPEVEAFDAAQWLKDLDGAASGCTTLDELIAVQNKVQIPQRKKVSPEFWEKGKALVLAASARILGEASDEAEAA